MIEQSRFLSLRQGDCCWAAAWLAPGDVVGEGCEQHGELLVDEAGCTLVWQWSSLVG